MNFDATFRQSLSPSAERDSLAFSNPPHRGGRCVAGRSHGQLRPVEQRVRPVLAVGRAQSAPHAGAGRCALCLPVLKVLSLLLGISDEFQTATRALLGVQVAFAAVLVAVSRPWWYCITLRELHVSGGTAGERRNLDIRRSGRGMASQGATPRRNCGAKSDSDCWGDGDSRCGAFVAIQTGWSLRPFHWEPTVATPVFEA